MPVNSNRANPMSASQASTIPNPFATGAQGGNLTVEATPEMRRGAHADFATVRTTGGVSTLDFLLVDTVEPSGDARGVLSSRVFLSNESLVALRDMLNEHTKGWQLREVK